MSATTKVPVSPVRERRMGLRNEILPGFRISLMIRGIGRDLFGTRFFNRCAAGGMLQALRWQKLSGMRNEQRRIQKYKMRNRGQNVRAENKAKTKPNYFPQKPHSRGVSDDSWLRRDIFLNETKPNFRAKLCRHAIGITSSQRDEATRSITSKSGVAIADASDNTAKFRLLLQPISKLADGWDMKSRPLYPVDPPAANKAGVLGLFVVILISAIIGRFLYIGYPFINDSGLYIHLGKTIAEGGRLYHDVFETKFPGAALVCAFFWTILGKNWAGYIAVQCAMSFAGSLALAYSMRRCVGKHAALPAMLFSMVFLNFGSVVYGGFQLETIQAFFAILAACGVMNALKDDSLKDAFLAGLAAGVAAMIKPTGAAVVGAFAVAAVFRSAWTWRRVLAHGAMCAIGLSVSVFAVLFYAWKANILNDLPQVANQISLYSKGYPFRWIDVVVPITALIVAGFPMYVRMSVFRKARVGSMEKVDRSLWHFALCWAVLELIGICAQGRFSAYYFMVLVPPLAIVYGLLPRRDWALPMAAGLVPVALLSIHLSQGYLLVALDGVKKTGVSEYIAANTGPNDAVWQEQSGRLLLESDRLPGSRYGLTFYFVNYDDAPYDYMQVMLKDFDARRPKYIVLDKQLEHCMQQTHDAAPCLNRNPKRWEQYVDAWDHLQRYVKANYRPEIEIEGNVLWRRIEAKPVQTAQVE